MTFGGLTLLEAMVIPLGFAAGALIIAGVIVLGNRLQPQPGRSIWFGTMPYAIFSTVMVLVALGLVLQSIGA